MQGQSLAQRKVSQDLSASYPHPISVSHIPISNGRHGLYQLVFDLLGSFAGLYLRDFSWNCPFLDVRVVSFLERTIWVSPFVKLTNSAELSRKA